MEILGISIPIWALLIPVLVYIYYKYTRRALEVFMSQGIKTLPVLPGFITYLILRFVGAPDERTLVKKYGKVYGSIAFSLPQLHVADVDMLRQIQVKEFNAFRNHKGDVFEVTSDIFRNMPFMLKDNDWKNVRHTVSPLFRGVELRKMTDHVNTCCQHLMDNFGEMANLKTPFDIRNQISAFSVDLITSTFFGIPVNSQKEPNNPFLVNSIKAFDFSLNNPIMFALFVFPPLVPLLNALGITFYPNDSVEFFKKTVDRILTDENDKQGKTRISYLQMIINPNTEDCPDPIRDARDTEEAMDITDETGDGPEEASRKNRLNYEQALGMVGGFIFGGYSTLKDGLTYTLYLLALHQDVQKKALDDINMVMEGRGELDYDSVSKMQYLGMVIQEVLRLYPPAPRTERLCCEDTIIKGIHIPKGMVISVSIFALHMDPEVWPDPEKFDPERFSPEQKAARDPLYWQPFGAGPRHCMAKWLVLMEMKMLLVHVLRKYKIKTCEKTQIPLRREGGVFAAPKSCFLIIESRE